MTMAIMVSPLACPSHAEQHLVLIENVGKCLLNECLVLVFLTSWWLSSKLFSGSDLVRLATLRIVSLFENRGGS